MSDALRAQIKSRIVETLGLIDLSIEDIGDDTPLFGDAEGSLGLDSVDALELIVVLEKDFTISIDADQLSEESLATVANLERFLERARTSEARAV